MAWRCRVSDSQASGVQDVETSVLKQLLRDSEQAGLSVSLRKVLTYRAVEIAMRDDVGIEGSAEALDKCDELAAFEAAMSGIRMSVRRHRHCGGGAATSCRWT